MSLRVRLGLAAGLAVAIAVLAVALSAYEGTRSELRDQLDDSLSSLSQSVIGRAGPGQAPARFSGAAAGAARLASAAAEPPGAASGANSILGIVARGDCDAELGLDQQPPGRFGEARGYVELVRSDGRICLAPGESTLIPLSGAIRHLASTGSGSLFTDTHAGSTHLRVYARGIGWRGALIVALPLTEIDGALRDELLLLVLIAAIGIGLAAVLGLLVARTALAPIRRFTRQTEAIAQRPDRLEADRLEVTGSDELARLGVTFNETLDALAASVQAQRNLVADASHELRTPIASIRANLQLMRDEHLLQASDREALRADVIDELDELTALVGDVVELARGSKPTAEPGEVRLDEIVAEAVHRARRRAPHLAFATTREPTLVRGEGERIARAVSNLLDNASKWSPEGEMVEIELRDGVLVVRDHGPGFDEHELPFVFDRFHRAKQARSKPGSGLGLAIVRQAAEAHGGFAQAANAADGGARLRVSFGPKLSLLDEERSAALEV
jgi:two-component system, OmpR family, sensor histidine kinase MprB